MGMNWSPTPYEWVGDWSRRRATLSPDRAAVIDRLARFKHPRSLEFVEKLPTSGPSKLDRESVKRRYGGDHA